jgi:hypothetical protein
VSQPLLSTAERFRRVQRDWEEYRRRSLYRRSHARFHRDLLLSPHRFLAAEAVRVAELRAPEAEIRAALRGTAVWTLDTALRFATGHRFLRTGDLTGYLSPSALNTLEGSGLIASPANLPVSLDPIIERPSLLVAHQAEVSPQPWFPTLEGDRVVTLDALKSDLLGTLGWRPDLLTRIEALYPATGADDAG